MNAAAVWPSAGISPEPNWFVVSMMILPSSDPADASASGIAPHGTESSTTEPNAAASAGDPVEARAPISRDRVSSFAGSREKESFTSCPALANSRAAFPPIRPAPMIPMRILSNA